MHGIQIFIERKNGDSSKRVSKLWKCAMRIYSYSKIHKEKYDGLKRILQKLNYENRNWQLTGDLKS